MSETRGLSLVFPRLKFALIELIRIWAFAISRLAILGGVFVSGQSLLKREWKDAGIGSLILLFAWIVGRTIPGSFADFCYGALAMLAGSIVFLGVTLVVVLLLGPLPSGVPLGPGFDERNMLGTILGFATWLMIMLAAIRNKRPATQI
jgi:hypothetical protein